MNEREKVIDRYIELCVIDNVAKHIALFDSSQAGYDFVEHMELREKINTLPDPDQALIIARIQDATNRTLKKYNG